MTQPISVFTYVYTTIIYVFPHAELFQEIAKRLDRSDGAPFRLSCKVLREAHDADIRRVVWNWDTRAADFLFGRSKDVTRLDVIFDDKRRAVGSEFERLCNRETKINKVVLKNEASIRNDDNTQKVLDIVCKSLKGLRELCIDYSMTVDAMRSLAHLTTTGLTRLDLTISVLPYEEGSVAAELGAVIGGLQSLEHLTLTCDTGRYTDYIAHGISRLANLRHLDLALLSLPF